MLQAALSLCSLVQGDDSVVAEIAKTSPNGEEIREKCKYAYIVGADGARSKFSFSSSLLLHVHYFLSCKVLCGNPSE